MGVWDTSTPVGSEAISSGDNRIREFKEALQEFLRGGEADGTVAIFPGPNPTTAPVYEYRGRKGSTAARPTSGSKGLYFDTSRNSLQRDNGVAWEDIGTNFPAGTVMIFAQAAAPTGWTKLVTQNDKALRIVSGSTGGSAGGSLGLSGGVTHSHTVASHVHDIPSASIEHRHDSPAVYDSSTNQVFGVAENPFGLGANATAYDLGTFSAQVGPQANKVFQQTSTMTDFADGNTGEASPATDSQSPVIAYFDVIQASKD